MTDKERAAAKLQSKDTGIELRKTFCGICTSNMYCGVDAYVLNDRIVKVEGTEDHPANRGRLCVKGNALRDYVYSPRRVLTPLRRTGPRGSGEFEPISWEEAYDTIARQLLRIRDESGADSVLFYAGMEKWLRPMLHRMSNRFGTVNFGTESSTCAAATKIAWLCTAGIGARPDLEHCKSLLGFSLNQYYSRFQEALLVEQAKERGAKIVVVDPRNSPTTQHLADIHLKNIPGTDGALALGMAKLFIDHGWIDQDYIDQYVYGFDAYADYVSRFDPLTVEKITGVPARDIERAVELLAANMPMAIHESVSPITHHTNGMQNYRAMISLSAITGCYDRLGGNLPNPYTYANQSAGFVTGEKAFIQAAAQPGPHAPIIGGRRFPLWAKLEGQCQMTDFSRHMLSKEHPPIRAVGAFGLNYRMLPEDNKVLEALHQLDFFFDVDLFMTDTARHADIVLPACTSVEREEFKIHRGGWASWFKPAIPPLGQSRPDSQIIQELSIALDLQDPLLRSGYEACMQEILKDTGMTPQMLKQAGKPIRAPGAKPYVPEAYISNGCRTPSGKFELYSQTIAQIDDGHDFDPLPTYRDSCADADPHAYPFILFTGSSLPHTLHSRTHHVASLRMLRPDACAELHPEDAERLHICAGDRIRLYTEVGSITVHARPTYTVRPGTISMYHGYPEADINTIIPDTHLDPYTGFVGFKSVRCAIEKVTEEERHALCNCL